MERNKKTTPLFLLLALLHVTVSVDSCPSLPDEKFLTDITCYSDYNHNITCVWSGTHVFDRADTVCTIQAEKENGVYIKYGTSCVLEPVDVSRPTLQKCTLDFKTPWIFQSFHVLSINLSCPPLTQRLSFLFKPFCHIKLNPPPIPKIVSTTVNWIPQVPEHKRIDHYNAHVQWKQEKQSWSGPSVRDKTTQCGKNCSVELDPDQLIQGERYEARIRVQAMEVDAKSTWSDWGPTASWESSIGRTKPPLDITGVVFGVAAAALVLAVFLAVITDKTTWVLKRIRGPPLLNPANSFLKDANFQNWLSPHFTGESIHTFLKPVEIVSVEITSAVDAVAPCGPEVALLEKMRSQRNHECTSSNFSNPSYSQLCPSPPVSSLTAGNLEPCAFDTPYRPVGSQGEGENADQGREEVRGKEMEILQLLSKGSNNSEPMLINSDYEKVEKLQAELFRLQSIDSAVCSGEEASQESMEADSISVTNSHDEWPEGKEERDGGNGTEGDFQKLFRGSGGIFGKGSIQVCSGYEQVQILQADSPELPSLDSGVSSGGEEQVSQEEGLEYLDKSTESTSFLFPPPSPPFSALPCTLPSFTPLPLNFSGPGLSPALPLPSHILERIALMSTNRLVEPSGDGYMPARVEQS